MAKFFICLCAFILFIVALTHPLNALLVAAAIGVLWFLFPKVLEKIK